MGWVRPRIPERWIGCGAALVSKWSFFGEETFFITVEMSSSALLALSVSRKSITSFKEDGTFDANNEHAVGASTHASIVKSDGKEPGSNWISPVAAIPKSSSLWEHPSLCKEGSSPSVCHRSGSMESCVGPMKYLRSLRAMRPVQAASLVLESTPWWMSGMTILLTLATLTARV